MPNKMCQTEDEFINEVTEAYNQNLGAGCYVGGLLRIINRQKAENINLNGHLEQLKSRYDNARAEIERLQKENHWFADIGKMYSEVRAEAVKEFAERLKAIIIKCPKNFISITAKDIDNLLKELVGEGDTSLANKIKGE